MLDKAVLCYISSWSHESFHVYSLVCGLAHENTGRSDCLVDIVVLPMGLQTTSATLVLSLTPPLGTVSLVQWLVLASASVYVRLWQSLSGDSILDSVIHRTGLTGKS